MLFRFHVVEGWHDRAGEQAEARTKAMAKRPSVQEILEAARKGGAAKPAAEPEPAAAPPAIAEWGKWQRSKPARSNR